MNEKPEPIRERAFKFAVRIVKMVRTFPRDAGSQAVARQLVRCGTSIGANIEEAQGNTTDAEFTHKLSIARREAQETNYWLRLIVASGILPENKMSSLLAESDELTRILVASTQRRRTRKADK